MPPHVQHAGACHSMHTGQLAQAPHSPPPLPLTSGKSFLNTGLFILNASDSAASRFFSSLVVTMLPVVMDAPSFTACEQRCNHA